MHIPRLDAVKATVKPRTPAPDAVGPEPPPEDPGATAPEPETSLSPEARQFLTHATFASSRAMPLEPRWKVLGITSGSVKERILDECRRFGCIKLTAGKGGKTVTLFPEAYAVLGIPRPTGKGTGGDEHKLLAEAVAAFFRTRGYEAHIEAPIGPDSKRVDVLLIGKVRMAVEIGLSSCAQEVRNCRLDLQSGAVDAVLWLTTKPNLLAKVVAAARKDPYLSAQMHRLRFQLWKGDASCPTDSSGARS